MEPEDSVDVIEPKILVFLLVCIKLRDECKNERLEVNNRSGVSCEFSVQFNAEMNTNSHRHSWCIWCILDWGTGL